MKNEADIHQAVTTTQSEFISLFTISHLCDLRWDYLAGKDQADWDINIM